jgi:hypothetical protein
MISNAADPSRTYAVLVGVEKYDAGADWNKLSILRDIREFHEWLRSKGVPFEQIITIFSPRDESVAALEESGLEVTPATSENVIKAFDLLQEKTGDLLFLYWAGHGAIDSVGKQRHLFLANATEKNKRNINLDELKESLASTYFKGFPLQILIVDTCATYANMPFTFPGEPIPCGKPLQHEQFMFFAARAGQVAKDLGEEGRGLLSRELLKQIHNADELRWPPDMRTIASRVQDEFAALRQTGKYEDLAQTPVFSLTQDWDGNEIKIGGHTLTPSSTVQGEFWKLKPKQLIALTDAVSSLSRMTTPAGRNMVLALMRSEIANNVPRGTSTNSDVMNILDALSSYPGGLEEFLWFLYQFDGQSGDWRAIVKVVGEYLPNLELPSSGTTLAITDSCEKLDLVEALQECPTLSDKEGRDNCIKLLDEPLPNQIKRQQAVKDDLLNIVSTCENYKGGIESLVRAMQQIEKDSLHMAKVRARADALLKSTSV